MSDNILRDFQNLASSIMDDVDVDGLSMEIDTFLEGEDNLDTLINSDNLSALEEALEIYGKLINTKNV
jgi:hypothetical protein